MHQVNFLPWRERQHKKAIRGFALLIILYGLIAFLVLAGMYFNATNQNQRLSEKLLIAQSVNGSLLKELNQIEQLQQKIAERERYINNMMLMKHSMWDKHSLFLHIERTLSNVIWLKTIAIEQGKLVIDGQGARYQPIIDFYQKMGSTPFISNLQLGSVSATEADLYSFSLTADWNEVEQ